MAPINPPAALLGTVNAIVAGRARHYDVRRFTGPLSLKAVIRGLATWETAAGRFEAGPSGCLIVNDGEEYSLTIDAPQPVETFCIFFARGFVEDAFRAATSSSSALLDAPAAPRIGFFERMQYEPAMRAALLRAHEQRDDDAAVDASMFALAETLVRAQCDIDARAARLPALKASTREELRRRLSVAATVIHARMSERLAVADVAAEACLSPFHFHRAFTSYFGETPHRYLTRLRLERARMLLRGTERSVADVARDCGFESLGTFTTLFTKRFGIPPGRFRRIGEAAARSGS
jgi:AraC family transcriptional regulator